MLIEGFEANCSCTSSLVVAGSRKCVCEDASSKAWRERRFPGLNRPGLIEANKFYL